MDKLGGVGALLLILALLGLVATFASWMEFGRWTDVLTWAGCGALAVGAVGAACVAVSERMLRKRQGGV